MIRIAVIAALPGELAPLVRGWRRDQVDGVPRWRHAAAIIDWTATCAGTGPGAVARAYAAALADGPLQRVISVGWAGALRADLPAASTHLVTTVIDGDTGERFLMGGTGLVLTTASKVADAAEKQRLAETGADLVDMEAAVLARLALRSGVGFACLKGISDALGDDLPDFNAFIAPDGKFQLARFVGFAAVRPKLWPVLMRLGRHSRQAAEALRTAVLAMPSQESTTPAASHD